MNPESKPLTAAEMDSEVGRPWSIDNNYMRAVFFGGDFALENKIDSLARDLSFGRYDFVPRSFSNDYGRADSVEEKQRLYREWTYARLYRLTYMFELAKQENLLVRLGGTSLQQSHSSSGAPTPAQEAQPKSVSQQKTFQ